jgi:asparagine synthase (glutamine-hydrolysing)
MCGICGVIQVAGEPRAPISAEGLDRMTDAMVHRGPNDRGTHAAPGIALGARRLSIVDVAGGHQPFSNEDDTVWAIQNGELYNHEQLRIELERRGHRFRSRCDTEVLPHLYEEYGPRFVERLRGKFGLAVWDARRRRAVVARDRLGVKPIYYARAGDLLLFGSELKCVLASGLVSGELDLDGIDAYLTLGFFPGPRTPLASVRKLMPGERLVVESGEVSLHRYWEFPEPAPDTSRRRVDDWAEELIALLEEAVRLRLMSDVPLGAMLSGGLDSSLIVALMARNMSEPVKTFSVGFTEAGDSNELADAREVAALYGAEHHELELSFVQQDVQLADLAWYLDEPLADLSSLGFLALSRLAAETVTVALAGQGADELLGGYSRHRNAALAARMARLPAALRLPLTAAAARLPLRFRRVAEVLRAPDPVERYLAANANMADDLRQRLVGGARADRHGMAARTAVAERLAGASGDPLALMLFLDGQLGLVDDMLHYFDRASMARSLEVRVPFLDHHVVEFCATVPSELKVRGVTTKYLLKRAARGIVPDRIIDKPKIGFFNATVGAWFRAQMQGAVRDYLLAPGAAYGELFDRSEVERLLAEHTGGRASGSEHALLSILMLEVWLSDVLPRALSPADRPREQIVVAT